MSLREPTIGRWYGVVCPSCYATVNFDCRSLSTYGIQCATCGAMVDLRNPTETLEEGNTGHFPPGSMERVRYAPEVEESDGLSATAQVNIVMEKAQEERQKVMPERMSGETRQAYSAQVTQAISAKFAIFHPVTWAIEYLVFGNKPDAKIGNVRIFRKRIPFRGYVNIPVPATSTSYAMPTVFGSTSYVGCIWLSCVVNEPWMFRWLKVELVPLILFYFLMYRLVYSDPGYVRPAYIDEETGRLPDDLTLKDIEANQRDSLWEMVDGVPMERKWCSTCNMHRPARAAHCYLCGLCVYDHDHHCTVIGACVGRRHVAMFATFVTISAISCIIPLLMVLQVWYYHRDRLTSGQFTGSIVLSIGLIVFSLTLSVTAVSMWQSVTQEASTRERLQNVYVQKRNPYDRGFFRNLYYHLWQRKVHPTLFTDEFVKKCAMKYAKRELGKGETVTCL